MNSLSDDPMQVLAWAVRVDESHQNEALLTIPLESASLYNKEQFAAALEELQKSSISSGASTTSPSFWRSIFLWTQRQQRPLPTPTTSPPKALTPMILSGFLTILDNPSSMELVSACQSMRTLALHRVRRRQQRQTQQRGPFRILFVAIGTILLVLMTGIRCHYYNRQQSTRSREMQQQRWHEGMFGHCTAGESYYETACRLAEAALWWSSSLPSVTPTTGLVSPTVWTVADVDHYHRQYGTNRNRWWASFEKRRRTAVATHPAHPASSRGIYQVVLQAMDTYLSSLWTTVSILDIGCGVGGLLEELLLWQRQRQRQPNRSFQYRGMAISAAEIRHAQERFSDPNATMFVQASFEDVDPSWFRSANDPPNVLIAIDSLSYSRNLSRTIATLLQSLPRQGLLMVVDDVSVVSDDKVGGPPNIVRPSVVSHRTWMGLLEQPPSCTVVHARDLSLEYDVVFPESPSVVHPGWWGWWDGWWWRPSSPPLDDRLLLLDSLWKDRADHHTKDTFAYNMYVCVKN